MGTQGSEASIPSGPGTPLSLLTHESSHRLTPSISIHVFSVAEDARLERWFRAGQNMTLQFPDDLDPIGGSHNLSKADRCLTFTPCHLEYSAADRVESVSLLARNGRVTGLLGLPRPQGPLTAQVVEVGGGFPPDILQHAGTAVCIAGGTGIACFLAMASVARLELGPETRMPRLCCSLRGDDFQLLEYLLEKNLLRPEDWASVRVFVTSGEEAGGLLVEKSLAWWQERFDTLRNLYPGSTNFEYRRMNEADMDGMTSESQDAVLFCGSKSLEWQIRMWSLGKAKVYCTDR